MKNTLLLSSILWCLHSFGQNPYQNFSEDSIVDKWMHATLNIQCISAYDNYIDSLNGLYRNNKISGDFFKRKYDSLRILTPRSDGTAVFFTKNHHSYLLTARHVVEDRTAKYSNSISKIIMLVETPQSLNSIKEKYIKDSIDSVHHNYFENVTLTITNEADLFFIAPVKYDAEPYIFSSSDTDMAIIYLDTKDNSSFLRQIISKGYRPVDFSDFDTMQNSFKTGEQILAIGFPIESQVDTLNNKPSMIYYWQSWEVTLPFISRGTISLNDLSKRFFEGDIFVYHGFSGGPVIDVQRNKMLGITHGANFEERRIKTEDRLTHYLYNHTLFLRASLIANLITKLDKKVKCISM